MEKQIDPANVRLMEFVMSQGGPSVVAHKLGKHPQLIYNLRDGKSKPSLDTLRDLRLAFGKKFDLDYVLTGIRSDADSAVADDSGLRLEMEFQRKQIERLEKENERLWRLALPDALKQEMGFLAASSQATGYGPARIGFRRRSEETAAQQRATCFYIPALAQSLIWKRP